MTLKQLFAKPVDRPIEGVIKADDRAQLQIEVEEYVLTNEIEKSLNKFLSAYNNYQGSNGVWISGFFGSGKSHLLKMLAYLLESKTQGADYILESFLQKSSHDAILAGDIRSAVAIPSKSILFNIDQKADVISKSDTDALLGVFVKVFNEMQGYFGKQGHIAQFERELDERGDYEGFKREYSRVAGKPWEEGREISLLEGHNIALAYAAATGAPASTAEGVLNRYQEAYSVSIEDFADMVHAYIRRQGPQFRLNFFVDEVGQYIADNTKLMTNLQTLAESLATKCRGRSWIIVTAQEEMNSVLGEMSQQQGNDFSKIQARFGVRMKLTSQDVAEVIQKRLLDKNATGVSELARLHSQQVNNFKTLFEFADGAQTHRNFRDADHFIGMYPFIPYQIQLFQLAIQALSQHSAFEGRHSSVGERSMLGVFQQVAMQIGNHEVGQLATFDLMFEGIRSSMKAAIQRAILNAEQNLDSAFAVRLLKALFLVKYVKEFKATEHNLTVLMTESFTQDINRLRKQVQEALNLLEQQTYIQRSGAVYEYLTDEEKDIEQEIKSTEVDSSVVSDELGGLVFDRVIRETKFRADGGQSDYPFMRLLDERQLRGRVHELAIRVISPFNEHVTNLPVIISQSMGRDELVIVMPADDRLVRDLTLYARTRKYLNQNLGTAPNDHVRLLLGTKQQQNEERIRELEATVRDLIARSTFVVNGQVLDLNGSDAQTKVARGFQRLIQATYPNLKMLPATPYRETDLSKYLNDGGGLFGNDAVELSEAEREVLNYVTLQKGSGNRVTLKALVEKFERKPHGWYTAAILCIVAKLCARGRVEVRQDGNTLEDAALEQALGSAQQHGNLIITPQEAFTSAQVRKLKAFFGEFFDQPAPSEEAKELANKTKEALQHKASDLTALSQQVGRYPFLSALNPAIQKLRATTGKPYEWYLTEFEDEADDLLDLKEDVISPVTSFMNGGQRQIFDDASDFIKLQATNLDAVGYDEALEIRDTLAAADVFRGDRIRRVKTLMDGLRVKIDTELTQAHKKATESIMALQRRLESDEKFKRLSANQREHILESFHSALVDMERFTGIAAFQQQVDRFQNTTYTALLMQIDRLLQPDQPGAKPPSEPQYVLRNEIHVHYPALWLEREDDVEAYLNMLRDAYLDAIRQGKRIQL